MFGWILLLGALLALGGVLYWLIVVTEGVYLGRRVVVWLYDRTAERYDTIKQFDAAAEHFFVIQPLLARLAAQPAPAVLDVATGTGRVPLFLLEAPTFNGRVIGLDASAQMLARAVDKLRPFRHRAGLVQQTAADLPFADDAFAAVTCLEALEFFPDERAALREMVRVLQPGGVLMVTRRRGWEARTFFGRYYSREAFAALLRRLGLTDVEIQPWQVDYDLVLARKWRGQWESGSKQ